jgi:N-acetylglutamate synthase-like GNAT family acetyltransferase
MITRPATISDVSCIATFFKRYFDEELVLHELPEFGCPMGVRAAIRKGEVLVAIEEGQIVAALRFYRRKRDGGVSLYQFAVEPAFRGGRIMELLLHTLGTDITAQCPKAAQLNTFYQCNGWRLQSSDNRFNYWAWTGGHHDDTSDE